MLPSSEINALIALYNTRRYAELEGRARQLAEQYPDFGFGWKLLGGALQMQGRNALPAFSKAAELMPGEADAHYNLGVAQKGFGLIKDAADSYRRAIRLKPDYAEAHANLGNVLKELGQNEEAVASYRRALQYNPGSADAHNSLGTALKDIGQASAAIASFQRALQLRPDFADAHYNLGNALKDLDRAEEAVASYRNAIRHRPDFALAYNNLGVVLHKLGRFDDASTSYLQAIEFNPNYVEALNNLANLLVKQGKLMAALNVIVRSLRIEDRQENKNLFISCVKRLEFAQVDRYFRDAMIRALSEPWCRPAELINVSCNIIKLNHAIGECVARAVAAWPQRMATQELFGINGVANVSDDALLCCLLKSAPICDFEIEQFLTMARYALLDVASNEDTLNLEENVLDFYSALAQQCFINEYVFAWTDAEAKQARSIRDKLTTALKSEAQVPVLWPLVVASYFPLYSLQFADRLLEEQWPEAVDAVLTQQIREPKTEWQYRFEIPHLTNIDSEISRLVQNQYEENPYPRWIKAAPVGICKNINELLHSNFPLSSFRPLGESNTIDILIAGCGTGQQSIETAKMIEGARMLAIDLSLTSLAYAQRKSRELGLEMIEYAQADIMKLGTLDRSFDVIVSSGVLHHLADPLAGWQVLLSLLRPSGIMRLGFYSEIARRGIVQARLFIAEQGYDSTTEDIRDCRQTIMNFENRENFGGFLNSGDFFSISGCRDLLFHVQEHRMTLTSIDAFLMENGLKFLGFSIQQDVLNAYKLRFPEDQAATNLSNWQIFEVENPNIFIGMYQFFVQKTA